jgi:hypothetical protein
MGIAEKIRVLLVKSGNISESELARRLQAEGFKMSAQNFNNKMKRESFRREELDAIARILEATYREERPEPRQWFTLKTGEEI